MLKRSMAGVCLATACIACNWALAQGSALLVSARGSESISATAAGDSTAPTLSPNGRFVSFLSHAPNLESTRAGPAPFLNLYVHDLGLGRTTLATVALANASAGGGHSSVGQFSADSKSLCFASEAGNLVAGDNNGRADVFVRDLEAGRTALVSRNNTDAEAGNGPSFNGVMSDDGRMIAFESAASDLVEMDQNTTNDVFLRDLLTGRTEMMSVQWENRQSGNGPSWAPVMTPDGRFVAFLSQATGLAVGATNVLGEIYVRDVEARVTIWASRHVHRFQEHINHTNKTVVSSNPSLSASGRSVVFKTASVYGTAVLLLHHDLLEQTTRLIATNAMGHSKPVPDASGPNISRDGRFVLYEAMESGKSQLYRWDSRTGIQVRVGMGLGSEVSASAGIMTPDGRHVAFLSQSSQTNSDEGRRMSELYVSDMEVGSLERVRMGLLGLAEGEANGPASMSHDGRMIAFDTFSRNVWREDLNEAADVFAWDRARQELRLVSVRAGRLAETANLGSSIGRGAFDDRGELLLFLSSASDIDANDHNSEMDVFVRDLGDRRTILVSASLDNKGTANGASGAAVLSRNGRYVAYRSAASDIVASDTNRLDDVFIRDLIANQSRLVSCAWDGAASAGGHSFSPSISESGRYVAFLSAATNLVQASDVSTGMANLYVRDLVLNKTILASVDPTGLSDATEIIQEAVLSSTGEWIVFRGSANLASGAAGSAASWIVRDLVRGTSFVLQQAANWASGENVIALFSRNNRWAAIVDRRPPSMVRELYLHDLENRRELLAGQNVNSAAINADGGMVAFETVPKDTNRFHQVWVFDRRAGASRLVSANEITGAPGDGNSRSPAITGDGRFIVFQSDAGDLVTDGAGSGPSIFIHDVPLKRTVRLPEAAPAARRWYCNPKVSLDGRSVAFMATSATPLAQEDFNELSDAFVLQLGRPDSDGDGLDDDWELTYFGTLGRDGASDFDGDGQTEASEFRAGTDPGNNASVFRVTILTGLSGGTRRIFWTAVPGKQYQVQFIDELFSGRWQPAGAVIRVDGAIGFLDLADGSWDRSTRFYRAVLVD